MVATAAEAEIVVDVTDWADVYAVFRRRAGAESLLGIL